MDELYKTVGVKLRAMEEEQKALEASRSPLNKLFKKVIFDMKSNI